MKIKTYLTKKHCDIEIYNGDETMLEVDMHDRYNLMID